MLTFLTKPDQDGNKGQEAKVVTVKLFKAGEDASEPFDFVEEALDQVTLFVEMAIIVPGCFAVATRGDDRDSSHRFNQLNQSRRIVCFVGNHIVAIVTDQECIGLRAIMGLSGREHKVQWIAQGIHKGVNLGAKAATAAT